MGKGFDMAAPTGSASVNRVNKTDTYDKLTRDHTILKGIFDTFSIGILFIAFGFNR